MTARELFVLGTASQVPTRHRNHNSFFLRWDRAGILFDPGEGTQRQMTLAGVPAGAITHICITHFHGDHCLGLPGVLQRLSLDAAAPVSVHYPASGQVFFERLRDASIYAHQHQLQARPIDAAGVIHEDEQWFLEAVALDHEVDCFGYRVREKDAWRVRRERLEAIGLHGPAVGQLLRTGKLAWQGRELRRHEVCEIRPGQSFAFVMDTRWCAGAEQLALGADLLVCEATFMATEATLAQQAGHMTARQAGRLARTASARQLVIGHFSQRYPEAEPLLAEARSEHDAVVAAVEPDVQRPDSMRHRIAVPERSEQRWQGDFTCRVQVSAPDTEAFEHACRELAAERVEMEIESGAGVAIAAQRHRGDAGWARAQLEGLALLLQERGFSVRQRSITIAPDAPGVSLSDAQAQTLSVSCHFEYRLSVSGLATQIGELQRVSAAHGADSVVVPERAWCRVTLRVPHVGRLDAEARNEALCSDLQRAGGAIVDVRRALVIYDGNRDLDRGWLAS